MIPDVVSRLGTPQGAVEDNGVSQPPGPRSARRVRLPLLRLDGAAIGSSEA